MSGKLRLAILSDVHYASAAEQARGSDFEFEGVKSALGRLSLKAYRRYVWLRDPWERNQLLDRFLTEAGNPDLVIANGDYACDMAYVGVSDDAAFESAAQCLEKLRKRFGAAFHAVMGDHEFGKCSLAGNRGGMRVASYFRAIGELRLQPFWQFRAGKYVLLAVTSSLVALESYDSEILPGERQDWLKLRAAHMKEVRDAFAALQPGDRVLLFCHDPTALPFLAADPLISERIPLIEQTIIGHLHSNLILRKSRLLAGMPAIPFLGRSAQRMTAALKQARQWKPFRVRLCPALSGIELLNDGGFYFAEMDPEGRQPVRFQFHHLRR